MRILKEANTLLRPAQLSHEFLDNLYTLSGKSLPIVAILGLLPAYVLFSTYGYIIVIWTLLLYLLLGYRFYSIAMFKKDHTRYSLQAWHKRFTFGALMVALLFGILGTSVISLDRNTEHHLFVIILLFGLSSGASTSLVTDHRLSILYVTVILISLVTGMLIYGTQVYWLISIIILIYIGSNIFLMVQYLRQEQELSRQRGQVRQAEQALEEKRNLIHHFIHDAPVAIFAYDTDMRITDANDTLLELFDSAREEILGLQITSLPENQALQTIKDALHKGSQIYKGPYLSKKGLNLWVEVTAFSFNDTQGRLAGGIGIINDRTKEHNALNRLAFSARHDTLTSLLNRRGLQEYLSHFIQKKHHTTQYSILFYLDLDKFKYINDSLGHKIGDSLLVAIADRLRGLSGQNCIISRFGGDEFIVLYPHVTQAVQEIESKAQLCMKQIKEIFSEPFNVDGMSLTMQTSIGIVLIEPGENDMDEIIRHADIAMYQAKKSHQTHISYYDAKLDQERKELFLLQQDLASAVQKNQLKLYLQPLVSISDDRLIAAECLIRWEHPQYGLLAPDRFIPAAIETGTISVLTWWIIEEVCKEVSRLKKAGIWNLSYISVNVDAKQLLIHHFVKNLLSIMEQYTLKRSELMIEIAEQSLVDNFEGAQGIVTALKTEGIHCAIDSFGIGYSSLSYLKKLSFHTLKIDKAFIRDIQNRPDDILLIKSILDIGRKLNYTIVAEGVETETQKKVLQSIDPDLVYQGYLLEKPISFDQFIEKYLQQH